MNWSLLDGPLPIALLVLALAGFAFLLTRRSPRRWWIAIVPTAAAAGLAGALLINWIVTALWRPFPDSLPLVALVWLGLAITSLVLLAAHLHFGPGWRRAIAALAIVAVAIGGINEVNRTYGDTPTVAAFFGHVSAPQVQLPARVADVAATVGAVPWHARTEVRQRGAVTEVSIPGVRSGFVARRAWLYFPPAYFARPRPLLPVLILLPGQPGTPRDWIQAGHVVPTMDEFARQHDGLAPIVVMPDVTGSALANTLCIDSARGNAATYLTIDVTDWVRKNLQVDESAAQWAIGGFSFGGTCALQFALGHPGLFHTFVDISGELGPSLGPVDYTIRKGFAGNRTAYDAAQPLTMIAAASRDPARSRQLHTMAGFFAVGAGDRSHAADQQIIARQCRDAGISVTAATLPGSHSWYVPAAALRQILPDLAQRLGLP